MENQGTQLKFFYDNMLGSTGSTISATSTASGDYAIDNIHNFLEVNFWMASSSATQNITFDAGVGNTKSADYCAIAGHNLGTVGASVVLQNSSDNFAANSKSIIALRSTANTVILQEARLLCNPDMEVWTFGASNAPDEWARTGVGSAIARDSTNFYSGAYGAALTSGTGSAQLYQNINNYTYYQGRTLTFGCQVKSTIVTICRVAIYDGLTYTYSSFHTGNSSWAFMSATKTISTAATVVRTVLEVSSGSNVAYFDAAVLKEAGSVSSTDVSDYIQANSNAQRYWRLKIAEQTGAPYLAIASIGNKTSLDYVQAPFDPYGQERTADINITQGGYVSGIHNRYTERQLQLNFLNTTTAIYSSLKTWWETHGLKNFFVAWDTLEHSSDIWLVRADTKFNNPINVNKYRDVTINLVGRKE